VIVSLRGPGDPQIRAFRLTDGQFTEEEVVVT
jgi:hypothetical protein